MRTNPESHPKSCFSLDCTPIMKSQLRRDTSLDSRREAIDGKVIDQEGFFQSTDGRKLKSATKHSVWNDWAMSEFALAEDQSLHPELQAAVGGSNVYPMGYYYSQLITGARCTDHASYVQGFVTNTCLVKGNFAQYAYCASDQVIVNYYNTTNCNSKSNLRNTEVAYLGCSHSFTEQGVEIMSSACTTSINNLPLTAEMYSTIQYSAAPGCDGIPLVFTSWIDGKCIPGQGGIGSAIYSFPNRTVYNVNTDCTGPNTTEANYFNPTCQEVTFTDDFYGTQSSSTVYTQASLLTGMLPTQRPTTNYIASYSDDDKVVLSLGGVAIVTCIATIAFAIVIGCLLYCTISFARKGTPDVPVYDLEDDDVSVENLQSVDKGEGISKVSLSPSTSNKKQMQENPLHNAKK